MKNPWRQRSAMSTVALAVLLAGCRSEPIRPAPQATANNAAVVDLDALLKSFDLPRPMLVIIAEPGFSSADNDAIALLEDSTVKSRCDRITPILLDIGISRNRATATRFHLTDTDTPMLVCLSPGGVIISRDEKPITRELVLKRIDEAVQSAPQLDARRRLLEEAVARNANDVNAKVNLADFLVARQNAREAVPYLESVAHAEAVDARVRVRAWVELARAHLWIAESEKSRHEAKDLIATLGPTIPEALAGGKLVLGMQDARGKRFALARSEFADAMAAAPDSVYAKQAAEAAAKLPTEGK